MSYNITYHCSSSLPRFSWGLELQLEGGHLGVRYGAGVEQFSTQDAEGLVEGAWDGSFADFAFPEASVFSGTGWMVRDGKLIICSSSDRVCPVFSVRKEGVLYISNSAIFSMEMAGAKPDPLYPFYNYDFLAIIRQGLFCMDGDVRLLEGDRLHLHISTIITVSEQGELNCREHLPTPEPTDFENYCEIVISAMRRLFANAQDSSRQIQLGNAAALSSGYDSCGTATLAKHAGCTDVFTLFDPKASDPHADSGRLNAESLGMNCREFDRWTYLQSDQLVEAEFCFNGSSTCVPMSAMEEYLRNRVYVIGSQAEAIWGNKSPPVYEKLSLPWIRSVTQLTQVEFRLRVGYLVLAPGLIAAVHREAMASIVHIDKMKQWKLEGENNRPAARRLAEEAGVPREQFGIKKLAGGHSALKAKERFSKAGYASYMNFRRKQKEEHGIIVQFYWRVLYALRYFVFYKLKSRKSKVIMTTPRMRRFPFVFNSAPMRCRYEYAFLFSWAFDVIHTRYRKTASDDVVEKGS